MPCEFRYSFDAVFHQLLWQAAKPYILLWVIAQAFSRMTARCIWVRQVTFLILFWFFLIRMHQNVSKYEQYKNMRITMLCLHSFKMVLSTGPYLCRKPDYLGNYSAPPDALSCFIPDDIPSGFYNVTARRTSMGKRGVNILTKEATFQ